MRDSGDTIFALSSGQGIAGVAVIRLSGPGSGLVLERLAAPRPLRRMAALRRLRDPETGEMLDSGLVLWFPAPQSFTGEDMAEFQVHGGRAVLEAVLGAIGRMEGLRAAAAGEFTLRAFRNGKLDLLAAEGLADLLQARSERQRQLALHQATGKASAAIEVWRQRLIGILGRVEAVVDFVDEAGVAEAALVGLEASIAALEGELRAALAAGARGRTIRDGARVVLAGPPNAGKSSLLNALAGREAAIVSAQPGTTRDVVEVELLLGGLPVVFCDTAGLRAQSDDEIELEGMARTGREFARADLVLWLSAPDVAALEPPGTIDSVVLQIGNKRDLLKSELRRNRNEFGGGPDLWVSARSGDGIEELLALIQARIDALAGAGDDIVVSRLRHCVALERVVEHLAAARNVSGETLELMAEELRAAAHELGRVTGAIGVEDLLGAIFSEFCIGK